MAKSKTPKSLSPSWVENIANRARCNKEDVLAFLKKHDIPNSPKIGRPKQITINRVWFTGTKEGVFEGDFEFDFSGLNSGLWGLLSDGNSKGKSSIIGVIKWLFRGTVPAELQTGVKSWLKKVEIRFDIGENQYAISIQQHADAMEGKILSFQGNGIPLTVSKFGSEEEMKSAVEEFMLSELGMAHIASKRGGTTELEAASQVDHGWPALSSVMFIGTNYSAIFGDIVMGGLSSRFLWVYLGLPWIPTVAALKALKGQLKSQEKIEGLHQDKENHNRKLRLVEIQKQLDDLRKKRTTVPIPKHSSDGFNELQVNYTENFTKELAAQRKLASMKEQLAQLEIQAKNDKIDLKDLLEHQVSHKIFKQLSPVRCPHCEQKVTAARIVKEQVEHKCAICDSKMIDDQNAEEQLAEKQLAAEASTKLVRDYKLEVDKYELLYHQFVDNGNVLTNQIEQYRQAMRQEADSARALRDLNTEIFKLEVLESEYNTLVETVGNDVSRLPDNTPIDDSKILDAAIHETEALFAPLKDEMLDAVSKKILSFCPKVGLEQYESTILNGASHLKIIKDGTSTSYSNVSPGEQLRLKIIANIALISVAEEKGYGRHPGFLIVDSPAAQDLEGDDLQSLMNGLKDLCAEVPTLQIIVASRANDILLSVIPDTQRKYAQGQNFLW